MTLPAALMNRSDRESRVAALAARVAADGQAGGDVHAVPPPPAGRGRRGMAVACEETGQRWATQRDAATALGVAPSCVSVSIR